MIEGMNLKIKKQQKATVVLLALALVIVIAYGYKCGFQKVCGFSTIERIVRSGREITLPTGKVYAEIVDTPASRELGLSGRTGLEKDEAMLFIFEHSGRYGFWMKDMLFSIDMLWIAEDGTVVHIERNVTPESYFNNNPPKTFVNTPDAKYVLELASGQADVFGLYLGTKVKIGE